MPTPLKDNDLPLVNKHATPKKGSDITISFDSDRDDDDNGDGDCTITNECTITNKSVDNNDNVNKSLVLNDKATTPHESSDHNNTNVNLEPIGGTPPPRKKAKTQLTIREKLNLLDAYKTATPQEKAEMAAEYGYKSKESLRAKLTKWRKEEAHLQHLVDIGEGSRKRATPIIFGNMFQFKDPITKDPPTGNDPNLLKQLVTFKECNFQNAVDILTKSVQAQPLSHISPINGAVQITHEGGFSTGDRMRVRTNNSDLFKFLKRYDNKGLTIGAIYRDLGAIINTVPQMRESNYTVDYVGLIRSISVQPTHMDVPNPNVHNSNGVQWSLPVQGTISLTDNSEDTIVYNMLGCPLVTSLEDLITAWKVNKKYPPKVLTAIMRRSERVGRLIKQWGHLMYGSHVRRQPSQTSAKHTMNLIHGSRPHCGPSPQHPRVVLFFTATSKPAGKATSQSLRKNQDDVYQNTQMTYEKFLWYILDYCLEGIEELECRMEKVQCKEFLLEQFALAIAANACIGTDDKTWAGELKGHAKMKSYVHNLKDACAIHRKNPSRSTEFDVQRSILALSKHEDLETRLKTPSA